MPNKFIPLTYKKEHFLQDKIKANENYVDFWKSQANQLLHWDRPFSTTLKGSFEEGHIQWFHDGQLNPTYNCLDRHIEKGFGDKIAYYFESEDQSRKISITYQELLTKVNIYCHLLSDHGAQKGDRIILYMPLGIEVIALMLACARMGLIHSVVFAGFSAHALQSRIEDCLPRLVFTTYNFKRAGKDIALYSILNEARASLNQEAQEQLRHVFVHHTQSVEEFNQLKIHSSFYNDQSLNHLELNYRNQQKIHFSPVSLGAEDPLFILYTSGSTGKPKGVLHTIGGYLTHVAYSFKNVFDHHPSQDIFWCTADVGWITGHSYVVYGPLLNRATSVLYDGAPSFPDWGRFWSLIQDYKVSLFYTAPTAIRSFMSQGDDLLKSYDLHSLRILGTVGEPINPAAWEWYHEKIGQKKCPIVDTWWQTETGGMMMTPFPGIHDGIPGFAMEALPGIFTHIQGEEKALLIKKPWPGMARTIYKDHKRFLETYFKPYPGYYFTGDGCLVNDEGFIKITGRIDDVLNVSGHRIGTAEVESALVKHPFAAEAAVVGIEDEIRGQAIICFVKLREETSSQTVGLEIEQELHQLIENEIGKFARAKKIILVPDLPKTRSGKIMRRILRKVAEGQYQASDLGDLSTLAIPEIVDQIIKKMGHIM